MVRKLNIPNQEPVKSVDQKGPRAKPLNLSSTPVVERKTPKVLNVPAQSPPPVSRRQQPRTKTDDLIDKATQIDPSIEPMRIRARIDALLAVDITKLLNWGESNLAHLRAASNVQSQIVARMAQINASGWLNESMEVSCKKPSFMDLLAPKKPPEYYESMLQKCRAELMQLVTEVSNTRSEYEPDVRNLQLDSIGLIVVAPELADAHIATERAKSLAGAHQTGVMLLALIDQTKAQCAQFIQQIDSFMNVTLPNWKVANAKS